MQYPRHAADARRLVQHVKWLQSPPDQKASLEPAYILGNRKLIPEEANAVESVLRTATRHYTSQCTRPAKPKPKNAEYEEDSTWQAEAEWQEQARETEEHEASKGKKGRGKRSKSKGKSNGNYYSKTYADSKAYADPDSSNRSSSA